MNFEYNDESPLQLVDGTSISDFVQETNLPSGKQRRFFLHFLKLCWDALPCYIDKSDPDKCNFPNSDPLSLGRYNGDELIRDVAKNIVLWINHGDRKSLQVQTGNLDHPWRTINLIQADGKFVFGVNINQKH